MPQTYDNHTRWLVPYHFVVAPLLLFNVILSIRGAIQVGGFWPWWGAAVAVATLTGIALARSQALTVQNRLIRLEERLRLQRLLPESQHGEIAELRVRQLIALRFASDAELPALFARVRSGELTEPRAIKQAVRDWRPDTLRV